MTYNVRYETAQEERTFNNKWATYQKALQTQAENEKTLQNAKAERAKNLTVYENAQAVEKKCLETLATAQAKIDRGQAKIKLAEAMEQEALALKEKAAEVREQKRQYIHVQLDKSITTLNSKITIVDNAKENDEKRLISQELTNLINKANQLNEETRVATSLQEVMTKLPKFAQDCNALIARIGKM